MSSSLMIVIVLFFLVLLAVGKTGTKAGKDKNRIVRVDHVHYTAKDEYECPACGAVFRKDTMTCPGCGVRFDGIRKDYTAFDREMDEEMDLEEDLFDDEDND